jgi:SAM-dependent methyltransferase
MPAFTTRDPADPGFWDERFAAGFTPWDEARTPPALLRFIAARGSALGPRVLVPGCGSGHEVGALAQAGFAVLAIDFAAQAIASARTVLPAELAARALRQADFFRFEQDLAEPLAQPPFDWIYERAFLPALPPAQWPAWSERVAALVAPGGFVAGLFFVEAALPERRSGPPFVTTRDELDRLLGGAFACTEAAQLPHDEVLPVFGGRLVWMTWQRR